MSLGRNVRVLGRYKGGDGYSLLVEHRGLDTSLLLHSNNTVQRLGPGEREAVRWVHTETRDTCTIATCRGEYDQLCDGHVLLGNLSVPGEGGHVHLLLLATQCTSVGEEDCLSQHCVGSVT